jgi:murein DD-endopeptidase MepM/ murein hydrolase activator NlpD
VTVWWRLLAALLLTLCLVGVPVNALAAPPLPSPDVWPVDPPMEVIRGFEPPAVVWGAGHRGVDLAAPPGTVVRAAAGGIVSFAAMLAGRGVLVVDHGAVRTTYEPVTADVSVGDVVVAGQRIGRLATGSHCVRSCLHWGLRQGRGYLNPLSLLGGASGEVRLVGAAERQLAATAAHTRAAAQAAIVAASVSAAAHSTGPAGRHSFTRPVRGAVTSGFGMRLHPVLRIWKLHDGMDIGAACGTPIRAPYAGRVRAAYFNTGYGNRLIIDHGVVAGRHVTTGLNHAASYLVGVGATVRRGQVIGFVGSTGYTTGCHLHLMVWLDGRVTNPMSWFS